MRSSEIERITSVTPLGPSGQTLAVYGQTPGTWDANGEYEGGRMGIWALPGDGGEMRLVRYVSGPTRLLDRDTDIVSSADGAWIAYARGYTTLHIINVATGDARTVRVSGDDLRDGGVYPAGADRFYVKGARRLSLVVASGGEPTEVPVVGTKYKSRQGGRLGTFDHIAASDNGRHFVTCGLDRKVGRSSEGKVISAVLGRFDHEAGVMRTRTIARVRRNEDARAPRGCAVSDDGSTAATVHTRRGKPELVALREGSLRRFLLPVEGEIKSVSPNGRYVLVQPSGDERGKARDLLVVDVRRSKVRRVSNVRLTNDYSGPAQVLWTPNAGRFVATSYTTKQSVWSIRPATGAKVRLRMASMGSWASLLRLSRDGSRVLLNIPVADSSLTNDSLYSVPLAGGPGVSLMGDVQSFGTLAAAADGSRAWLVSSWTCSEVPKIALQRLESSSYERETWQQTGPQ